MTTIETTLEFLDSIFYSNLPKFVTAFEPLYDFDVTNSAKFKSIVHFIKINKTKKINSKLLF